MDSLVERGIPLYEALAALRHYCASLDRRLERLRARWQEQLPLPYFVDAMFDLSVTLVEAERDWAKRFVARVESMAFSDGPAEAAGPFHPPGTR
jgi:hypothetical protein